MRPPFPLFSNSCLVLSYFLLDLVLPFPTPLKSRSYSHPHPHTEKLEQSYLDVGQRNFGSVTCEGCGMLYNPGKPEDEEVHTKFHKKVTEDSSCIHFPVQYICVLSVFYLWSVYLSGSHIHQLFIPTFLLSFFPSFLPVYARMFLVLHI